MYMRYAFVDSYISHAYDIRDELFSISRICHNREDILIIIQTIFGNKLDILN